MTPDTNICIMELNNTTLTFGFLTTHVHVKDKWDLYWCNSVMYTKAVQVCAFCSELHTHTINHPAWYLATSLARFIDHLARHSCKNYCILHILQTSLVSCNHKAARSLQEFLQDLHESGQMSWTACISCKMNTRSCKLEQVYCLQYLAETCSIVLPGYILKIYRTIWRMHSGYQALFSASKRAWERG